TSRGGLVAIDSTGSTLTTGASTSLTRGLAHPSAGATESPSMTGSIKTAVTGAVAAPPAGAKDIDINGYEDHSVNVAGNDNAATYDDSNLFVNRDGAINGNTGDTDSSGLNAVDTVDSTVRSGPSRGGDDTDSDDSGGGSAGSDDGEDSVAANPAPDPASSAVAPSAVAPSGSRSGGGSGGSLSIGGDGFDDISLNVRGDHNVATEDDGNVVIGGRGDVNAQIGDSDTSGTVAMHTVRSTVEGALSQ
ncbi:MAG: hypothetical protein JWO63_1531, partial [Frankiales bacterium]|nr:hypothetical protein [Frankiales bacterium]